MLWGCSRCVTMSPKRQIDISSQNLDRTQAGITRRKRPATTDAVHKERQLDEGGSATVVETTICIHGPRSPARTASSIMPSSSGTHEAPQLLGEGDHHHLADTIMAIDMRENSTLGCAIFSTNDSCLSVGQDFVLADSDLLEHLLVYAQPTVVIISTRPSERLKLIIDSNAKLASQDGHQPQITICPVDASEFSPSSARERLLNTYSDMNMENQATFSSRDPENGILRSSMPSETLRLSESQNIKLLRLGTVVDLASTVSLTCAGVLISEAQHRRAVEGRQVDYDSDHAAYRIQTLTSFSLSNQMFVNFETLAALQIVQEEMHPNTQIWNRDSGGSEPRESLSVYGLFHNLASTSQGRLNLRTIFLRPTMDIETVRRRHATISVLVQEQNAETMQQMIQCLRQIPNGRRFIPQLQKGIDNASVGTSFEKGLWRSCERFMTNTALLYDSVKALAGVEVGSFLDDFLRKMDYSSICTIRGTIVQVVDFELSKQRQRPTVRTGLDKRLDKLKRQYDGMESFLTEVVNHIINESPPWASRYIRSCIFLPQIGFLTVVDVDEESGDGKYEGEEGSDGFWEKILASDGSACYKNKYMRELDNTYGDVYCEIGDREVEIMHSLASKVLELTQTLVLASDLCGELDSMLALAIGAQRYNWTCPTMTESRSLNIKEGRHPLQQLVVPCFVTNDCVLPPSLHSVHGSNDCSRTLVLTGPNHSGKSVYLKQVAIIVYLSHIGSFVPAKSALVGTTDRILTRMSTNESVSKSESAFAIDLRQTLQVIRLSTPKSLVLIDEFGKGTCPTNGAGLMAALLDHMLSLNLEHRPRSLVATHFHEIFDGNYLKTKKELSFSHMNVRLDMEAHGADDQVTYLFKVSDGRSTSSFGAQCAAMNGMPSSIVERAEAISLLISRNEDLTAFCARLTDEEESRLEVAEGIARGFVGHDMRQWNASSARSAKKLVEDLLCAV